MHDIQLLHMTFEEKAIKKLEEVMSISLVENYFLKNQIKFGFVKDEDIYLVSDSNNMQKISKEILRDTDAFLMMATKAYWIASGKDFDNDIFFSLTKIDE